jgi:SAM-dependent methyltransferase
MYKQVIHDLRQSYNRMVEERDKGKIAFWKIEERDQFLSLLQKENKKTLLEIGAGTGIHGKFFQDNGLQVTCTDLAPEMVKRCQQKGLIAYVMDFLNLEFSANSFDAVYALNCLLHVPEKDLSKALSIIQNILRLGGLFYLGQYGGLKQEGVWPEDHYEPKRFFSFFPDEQIQEITAQFFEILYFKQVSLERATDFHFQSMILRRN